MNNYKIIKEFSLEEMAFLFSQISLCYRKSPLDELPTAEDWKTYLLNEGTFLPLSKRKE